MEEAESSQGDFQIEYEDFINFRTSDESWEVEEYLGDESDEELGSTAEVENTKKAILANASPTFLKASERELIEKTTDPDLKKLLLLNRKNRMEVLQFQKKLVDLLLKYESFDAEEDTNMYEPESCMTNYTGQMFPAWKCAAPYFKTTNFFVSPYNTDVTNAKRLNGELSAYDLYIDQKWTKEECDKLISGVKCNYNVSRQRDIMVQISQLTISLRDDNVEGKEAIMDRILDLQQVLEQVKDEEDIVPPQGSDEHIDWERISNHFMGRKHSAEKCRSMWHIYLHPSVNKEAWTDEENNALLNLVHKYDCQDWEAIAEELGTGRTAFVTCLHYFRNLCSKLRREKFSLEEDARLMSIVEENKVGSYIPWAKVAQHFTDRSRTQLYHRYRFFLSCRKTAAKGSKFTAAEDILLLILVDKFKGSFQKCSEYMPHRSMMQLKCRYDGNLKQDIKKGTWTQEEDEALVKHVQTHGEAKWSLLRLQLNRCRSQLRQRYQLVKSFFIANPGKTVADVPKRKHVAYKEQSETYKYLKNMADQYKQLDTIPTLAMIESALEEEHEKDNIFEDDNVTCRVKSNIKPAKATKKSGAKKTSDNKAIKEIDAVLMDLFSGSEKVKPQNVLMPWSISEATDNVKQVLNMLSVDSLTVPANFESDPFLDEIDKDILRSIASFDNELEPNSLIPPNLNSVIGLRSLLVKHRSYRKGKESLFDYSNVKTSANETELLWNMEQTLANLDECNRTEILSHRVLFSKRFNDLFTWSSILSLEKPSDDIDVTNEYNSKSSRQTDKGDSYVKEVCLVPQNLTPVTRIDQKIVIPRNRFDARTQIAQSKKVESSGSSQSNEDVCFVSEIVAPVNSGKNKTETPKSSQKDLKKNDKTVVLTSGKSESKSCKRSIQVVAPVAVKRTKVSGNLKPIDAQVMAKLLAERKIDIRNIQVINTANGVQTSQKSNNSTAEVVKPGVVKPRVVKPGVVKPRVVKPGVVKPRVVKPRIVKKSELKPVDANMVKQLLKDGKIDIRQVRVVGGAQLNSSGKSKAIEKKAKPVLVNEKLENVNSIEEYEVVKDDTQLLDEIMNYEKNLLEMNK